MPANTTALAAVTETLKNKNKLEGHQHLCFGTNAVFEKKEVFYVGLIFHNFSMGKF